MPEQPKTCYPFSLIRDNHGMAIRCCMNCAKVMVVYHPNPLIGITDYVCEVDHHSLGAMSDEIECEHFEKPSPYENDYWKHEQPKRIL